MKKKLLSLLLYNYVDNAIIFLLLLSLLASVLAFYITASWYKKLAGWQIHPRLARWIMVCLLSLLAYHSLLASRVTGRIVAETGWSNKPRLVE